LEQANQGLNAKVAERTRELSRFKVLLDASSEGILVASATSLDILDWNEAAARLLNLQLPIPADLRQIPALSEISWREYVHEGSRLKLEATPDQPIDVSGNCQAFDGELYLVLVVRDASQRLSLEKQLLSAQKVEVIGQLAGGIAHDFNNMLTVVLGVSEYLCETFDSDDPRRQDLTDILETGGRAKELTAKLLRLSRSKLDTPELVDLNERVRDLSSMLRRSLGGGIELVVLLGEEPAVVRVVPGDLDQVLLNLAVNASDAMPEGGTLTIELGRVPPPGTLPPGPYVSLEIVDTGLGMTPEVLARAFEPFFSTKGNKGHGLGLAVSESILRRVGGCMTVDSTPGKGTTFRIWLPLLAEEIAPRRDGSGAIRIPAGGTSILLVEDQDALRGMLERQLRLQGYQVTVARSCEEALALSQDQSFQLLLSDIVLPGMTGVELARRLAPTVPHILMMSGYADQAPTLDGKSLPLLNKPFTTRQLSKCLLQVLADKAPTSG
jgi:two-component system cell cycle sensor histidine kinase/response regulator CckA